MPASGGEAYFALAMEMTAMARTPVLPEATPVGALSAQCERPRSRSAMSAYTSIPAVHCVSSRSASSAIRSLSRPYDSPPVRLYRRSAKRQNGRSCDPYEVQS